MNRGARRRATGIRWASLLEIRVGEIGERSKVDVVLYERLRVFAEAELTQPVLKIVSMYHLTCVTPAKVLATPSRHHTAAGLVRERLEASLTVTLPRGRRPNERRKPTSARISV